jgi:hypothetical protein
MSLTLTAAEGPVMMLAAAVAMLACVHGWNAAEHRKAAVTSAFFAALFWMLAAFLGFWAYQSTKILF